MKWVRITNTAITVNGTPVAHEASGIEMLKEIYKREIADYPKFYKMDPLSQLGFVASEMLLQKESPRLIDIESRAVILLNRSSSLCDDKKYQSTIQTPSAYFPSPAVFVYTLPNIVTGEISIRNKYYGETLFCVSSAFDTKEIVALAHEAFQDETTTSVLTGWLECDIDGNLDALLLLADKDDPDLNEKKITQLYNNKS